MLGAVRSAVLRSVTGAMLLGSTLVGRQVAAQQVNVASARVTSTALNWTGPDSGKALLSVEIVGLPGRAQSASSRDQVKVADDVGHTYTPVGIAVGPLGSIYSLVPEYLQSPGASRSRPQYLFFVPPGKTRFVLHVPSRQPVAFTASFPAGALR